MEKKAQITVFVIIGIVLLFIVGIFLFIRAELNKNVPPDQAFTEQVAVSVQPIKDYMQDCLGNLVQQGVVQAGLHGGYIYPEDFGLQERINPTNSPGVNFVPDTSTFIPYWFYLSSAETCTECTFASERLPLQDPSGLSVEGQMQQYVLDQLPLCVEGLAIFEDKGFTITSEDPQELIVLIGEEEVSSYLNMPLEIEFNGQTETITKYQSKIDVSLKEMYAVATTMLTEMVIGDEKIFERMTREVIDGQSLGEHPPIPPTSGPMDISLGPADTWSLSETRELLKGYLVESVPAVQIEDSAGYRVFISDNEFSNSIYNSFLIPLDGQSSATLQKYEIDFLYLPWWEPYLKIKPSSGEYIKPDITTMMFPIPTQIKRYEFGYDLSYPVVVTLRDPNAFAGEGYTFQFAFEVTIRDNDPIDTSKFQLIDVTERGYSLFDHESNRFASLVTITTTDYYNQEPLEEVALSYHCGEESVYLGATEFSSANKAVAEVRLPVCVGGFITADKVGYFADPLPFDAIVESDQQVIDIDLYEERTLDLKVKYHTLRKDVISQGAFPVLGWQFFPDTFQDPDVDDEVLVMFIRQSDTVDDSYIVMRSLADGTFYTSNITLVPGSYKVEAFAIRYFGEDRQATEHLVPEDEICVDTQPLNPLGGEECETIPEIVFNESLPLGGVVLDRSTGGFFNISKEDLLKDTITVYLAIPKLDDITKADDIEWIDKAAEMSTNHRMDMLPTFD